MVGEEGGVGGEEGLRGWLGAQYQGLGEAARVAVGATLQGQAGVEALVAGAEGDIACEVGAEGEEEERIVACHGGLGGADQLAAHIGTQRFAAEVSAFLREGGDDRHVGCRTHPRSVCRRQGAVRRECAVRGMEGEVHLRGIGAEEEVAHSGSEGLQRTFPALVLREDGEQVLRLDDVAHAGVVDVVGKGVGQAFGGGKQAGEGVPAVMQRDGAVEVGAQLAAGHLSERMCDGGTHHVHVLVVYIVQAPHPLVAVPFDKLACGHTLQLVVPVPGYGAEEKTVHIAVPLGNDVEGNPVPALTEAQMLHLVGGGGECYGGRGWQAHGGVGVEDDVAD